MSGARPDVTSVIIEADGGSRGNPGPASYGAVLKDAATGAVIAEDGTTIGVATNNVAEYSGLIAGLRLAEELTPNADIEVRMDSKLVVEQMSGRWKIKHPDMRPLAMEANRLAPFGTTYTWVPRERNKHADRLANEALDGKRSGVTVVGESDDFLIEVEEEVQRAGHEPGAAGSHDTATEKGLGHGPDRGWSPPTGPPTTLVLVRHGVTPHTVEKRFSGGLASANPGLSDDGRDQVRATAAWLSPLAPSVDAVIASPVRRARESADIVAATLEIPLSEEPGFAEMEFGAWDGMTFAEVAEKHPGDLEAWMGSMDVAPGGGESFRQVEKRVMAALERVLEEHEGQTVVVVSHVTPIKILVAHVLRAPLESLYRMELTPASVTVLSFYGDGPDGTPMTSMRLYNARPGDEVLPPPRF